MNIRPYEEKDFPFIHQLNEAEGWSNLVKHKEITEKAWRDSNVTFVVEEAGEIVGYVRGITDGHVTLYVCELLIRKSHRGKGIGTTLLKEIHHLYPTTRMELLASTTSKSFYEKEKFRPFYAFRKTIEEWE
ncbi:GNAT family N-acetyltransferase [Salirhabdus sp. Marseille-P4669]|uniref:GNAT family N-acetyltransferase n=1 Tax=Salirhabdus sp. Marseille-P4669 TaxID=2042310 RepID=UPI000C7B778B|nr:GNAT family N-acetyltransferase [Salirhabdus sp. Marseille-P4669]